MSKPQLHSFEAVGIELEYMIVKQDSLNIHSVSDKLLSKVSGNVGTGELERGNIGWSNEFVKHVIEFKTIKPVASLNGLASQFKDNINFANKQLSEWGGRLLPSAMHPWMDPFTEPVLWQKTSSEIFKTYERIFGAKGHGWSNLQSTHINLPFNGDDEFVSLHDAIRVVLPLIPALAASSPIYDGKISGLVDTRLEVYRFNQKKIPEIVGKIVPEVVDSIVDYHTKILNNIYNAIRPYDRAKVMQEEWLNSRGSIARFDRNAIEIRVMDIQECPDADIAIIAFIVELVKNLSEEVWSSNKKQAKYSTIKYTRILLDNMRNGLDSIITHEPYLRLLDLPNHTMSVREVLQLLLEKVSGSKNWEAKWSDFLYKLLEKGNLSERILKALPKDPSRNQLRDVYYELGNCLENNIPFRLN